MVYKFVVTLKNKNQQLIDWFTIFICLISVISFFSVLIQSFKDNITLLVVLIAGTLAAAQDIYIKKKTGRIISFRDVLLLIAIGWMCMPFLNWVAVPLIILALIEKQAKFPIEIGFTDEHVMMNTLFKKKFSWTDFDSIILRDGYLTLNFKNNRLIQQEVLDDEDDDGDEDEFNEYCKARLAIGN